MKPTLITLFGAVAAIAASTTAASAQVLSLSGQYQCVQRCVAGPLASYMPAYITQADRQLNLVNEAGVPSRGWIDYPGYLWAEAWNEGAVYSPDGMTIQFDRGTVWRRVVELPPRYRVYHRHYHPRPLPANG